jgi:hypothetical protein
MTILRKLDARTRVGNIDQSIALRAHRGLVPVASLLILGIVIAATGCGKSNQESTTAPTPTPAPAATAPATPASTSAGGNGTADTTAKLSPGDAAVKLDAINTDPNGQWAISATASSSYNNAQGAAQWSANQATGAPDVAAYADDGKAWAPSSKDAGLEWLDLKFPKAVHATEVRVRESFNSGTVVKVELIDDGGTAHTAWAGNDPTTGLNYLLVTFPRTDFKTAEVKIILATNISEGWKEIDAVQLVGTDQ